MCTVCYRYQDFLDFLPFISFICFWILGCQLTLLFSLIEFFPLPNTPAVYKDLYYLTPEKLFSPISLHTLHYLGNSYSGGIASSPKMPWFLSSLRNFHISVYLTKPLLPQFFQLKYKFTQLSQLFVTSTKLCYVSFWCQTLFLRLDFLNFLLKFLNFSNSLAASPTYI